MKPTGNKIRNIATAAAMTIVATGAFAAGQGEKTVVMRGYKVAYGINTPAPVKAIGLEVDSVMFRDDVTRVYGKITGPHNTSARIDRIVLTHGKERYVSNDIDGFDYERAFQWEEDGSIPVEIDFAPIKSRPEIFVISAETPRGTCLWSVAKKH